MEWGKGKEWSTTKSIALWKMQSFLMVLSIGIERSSGLKASPLWGRRNFVFSKTSWHNYALQDIFCFLFLVVFIIIIKDTVLVPLSLNFQRSRMFLLCITLSTADIKIHLKLTERSLFDVAR